MRIVSKLPSGIPPNPIRYSTKITAWIQPNHIMNSTKFPSWISPNFHQIIIITNSVIAIFQIQPLSHYKSTHCLNSRSNQLALCQKNASIWWLFCVCGIWNNDQQIMNQQIVDICIEIVVQTTPSMCRKCCISNYMYHIDKKVIR